MNIIEPFFSIIVPTYNRSLLLDKIFRTLSEQTFNDWECIIIDDGSSDITFEVVQKFTEADSRFKFKRINHGGLSNARNVGLLYAEGKYIIFLDDDDFLRSDALEIHFIHLKNNKDISVSDYLYWDVSTSNEDVAKYLTPFFNTTCVVMELIEKWEEKLSIPCHCIAFRNELIQFNSIKFNETLENHEDWYFWVRVFYFSQNIVLIQEKLAYYCFNHDLGQSKITLNVLEMKSGFRKAALLITMFFGMRLELKLSLTALLRYLKSGQSMAFFLFRILYFFKIRYSQLFKRYI